MVDNAKVADNKVLTPDSLRRQTACYRGRGGVSRENRGFGFAPAFLDTETGTVYRACFADGRPAPLHVLDGLPEELVVARRESGAVVAVRENVVAGFIRRGRFFTREQAARCTKRLPRPRRARRCRGACRG